MRVRDQLARVRQVGAALTGVEVLEQAAALRVGHAVRERAPVPQRIPGRRLDLDDVGAEVDKKLRGVGT
jgi:hypothetical protein